jgi:hypothetical protein
MGQTRLSEHSRLSIIARWTMHAFDFILVLLCFVYAAAVTHVLSTAGEIHHRFQAHPARFGG